MSGHKKTVYFKNEDGFILNVFYKDGDEVELFEKQAKYLITPLGTELRKKKDAPVKQDAANDRTLSSSVKEKPSDNRQGK